MPEIPRRSPRPPPAGTLWLWLAVAVGVGMLLVALFGEGGYREVRRLHRDRAELAAEIDRLRSERRRLEQEIANLRENPREIARRARRDLGMIKEGETVFLLPDGDDDPSR